MFPVEAPLEGWGRFIFPFSRDFFSSGATKHLLPYVLHIFYILVTSWLSRGEWDSVNFMPAMCADILGWTSPLSWLPWVIPSCWRWSLTLGRLLFWGPFKAFPHLSEAGIISVWMSSVKSGRSPPLFSSLFLNGSCFKATFSFLTDKISSVIYWRIF